MKNIRLICAVKLLIVIIFFSNQLLAQQQVENTMSQYFRNRILLNAGYTGFDGNRVSIIQNRSWLGFDGAPVLTSISGELNFGLNSAAGLNLATDKSGVLIRTFGVFNYAYKVKLNDKNFLRIGTSLQFHGDRINDAYIASGGIYDPIILENIDKRLKYDGNFGVLYKRDKLELSLSLLQIGRNLRGGSDNANLPAAQLAAYYDFALNTGSNINLKPMMMYKTYKNTPNIFGLGVQFSYNEMFNLMAVYQSTGSISNGAGFRKLPYGEVNIYYHVNTKISNASSQQFEFSLLVYLKDLIKKKTIDN